MSKYLNTKGYKDKSIGKHNYLLCSTLFLAGVFLVAGLNMLVGSISFIYNLRKLRKERHISSGSVRLVQVLVCIHLLLWCSILLVFLPDLDKVENALNEELEEI